MRRSCAAAVCLLAPVLLSACNSSERALAPSSALPPATQAAPGPATAGLSDPIAPGQSAAAATTGAVPAQQIAGVPAAVQNHVPIGAVRLQIAPLVGAPADAAKALTERLGADARSRGITLVAGADKTATHIVKGYFSAITEGKDTTVIYVWDVYDPAGNRLHRISGQLKASPAGKTEGWGSVSAATMQAIADATVEQFSAWLGGRTS